MCGRYHFYDGKNKDIQKIIEDYSVNHEQTELALGEIFPSNEGLVLVKKEDDLEVEKMCWGYPKENSKVLIINARIENLNGPYFKDDHDNRRCVVPVSGYYEWDRNKKKHYIHSSNDEALYLGAIYRKINEMYYYCIVTKDASESLKIIHNRMPITMNKEQAIKWLNEKGL